MSHHANNQMTSSASDYYSTKPELSGLKNHRLISGVVEAKSPSDYELAWSPTSPLDFRFFSSLGNPFGGSSSRSIWQRKQKSWDSGKVGLSILHSLGDDHHQTDSSRILLPSPDSKNMIFGSMMRNGNLNCQKPVLSQPFAKAFMPKTDMPNVVFGLGHKLFDVVELQRSGSVDTYCVNNNAFNERTESDIEMSEDYTCITSHGPNPKTTHIFGDQVLESVEVNELKKLCCGNKKESIFEIASTDLTPIDVLHPNNFLSTCYLCSKKLDIGKDIYMYSGYKAFCSSECRQEVVDLDEELMEEEGEEDEEAMKSGSSSDEDLSKKKSNSVIFTMG